MLIIFFSHYIHSLLYLSLSSSQFDTYLYCQLSAKKASDPCRQFLSEQFFRINCRLSMRIRKHKHCTNFQVKENLIMVGTAYAFNYWSSSSLICVKASVKICRTWLSAWLYMTVFLSLRFFTSRNSNNFFN